MDKQRIIQYKIDDHFREVTKMVEFKHAKRNLL